MGTTIYLLACALALGQASERGGWEIAPRLEPGMELVYKGTYTEKSLIPNVQFERTYRLENLLFVLKTSAKSADVAIQTSLSLAESRAIDGSSPEKKNPTSVRLELAVVDFQGRLTNTKGQALTIPLAAPATLETGIFIESPPSPLAKNQSWEVSDEDHTPRTWQAVGAESCNGVTCVKIVGEQQSADWEHPRADQTAWRRRDILWIAPQLGVAYKVERTIERRDPARRDPTQITEVHFELESRLKYPGKLFEDRRQDIEKAKRFQDDAQALLRQPAHYRGQIDNLLHKIASYRQTQAPTPYGVALAQLERKLESAQRGETSPEPIQDNMVQKVSQSVAIGDHVPDFVVSDLTGTQSARLNKLLGRPVLVFFYNPATPTGKEVLEFAQGLLRKHGDKVNVLAMAVTKDANLAAAQHKEMGLTFPILDGQGLHRTFGVDATPRLVLLDGDGIVRGTYTGWGFQTPMEINEELAHCFPAPQSK